VAHNSREGTGLLEKPVFYGRPILRIPDSALLQADEKLQQKVQQYMSDRPLTFGSSDGEAEQILTLALALLHEQRQGGNSFVKAVTKEEPPLLLLLTERQRAILAGTTVESLPEQAKEILNAMISMGEVIEEATWALGVILRRAQHVISPEDGKRLLRLAMLPELLALRHHPDAAQAPPLHRATVTLGGQERNVLLRAAERDYQADEEIFLWSGRFSESELILRGTRSESSFKNPTGVGGKVSIPENWNSNPRTPNYKEFRKFNCTSQEAFEVRLSKKGWPMRSFVRCFRVAWLLLNNWYKPQVINQTNLLDKWPPPKKYSHEDWLGWTQADQATNLQIQEYCQAMRTGLRESITSVMAEDFRTSQDPVDQQLWRIRSEESKAFKECIALAKSTGITGS